MNTLLVLSISLLCGLLTAKLLNRFKLPSVTGYLIAGLFLGPSIFNIIPAEICTDIEYISEFALGIIAFNIGGSFELSYVKKLGKSIIILTLIQALGTAIIVFLVINFITHDLVFSLLIGAISSATAPAATLLVIKEFKAKGPLTDTLLAVVALDDMVCLFIFSISTAIAKVITANTFNIKEAFFTPLLEICSSIILGIFIGFLILSIIKHTKHANDSLVIVLGTILLGCGVAKHLHLSPLLTCMCSGVFIANLYSEKKKLYRQVEFVTPPIYILFFTFAGIGLDISVLSKLGILGLAYILSRTLGKIIGSYIGSLISKSPKVVKKYIGFGLLPQAGVAIGLAMIVMLEFPEFGKELSNIVMGAVLIYEIIGPILTRIILYKAKEIDPNKKSINKTKTISMNH
ncbi:cation:proton antiporter [Abyssisolibacter fermentans]|uniref:cation:proton antiporter n=1 Tax=Abyssisolibacter fermentans TaxID=1766203 RepID=UPI00082D8CFC|nr:cation:proton antiporter [Abyssisolibacter fermentans]